MFEALEQRRMFDISGVTSVVMTIEGTGSADVISLSQQNGKLVLTKNGVTTEHALSGLSWTTSRIVLKTYAGDDSIEADASVTKPLEVFAGDGSDQVTAGSGRDLIHGGAGVDFLHGKSGDDAIWGDGGNDWLFGEDDRDRLYGGADTDFSFGGPGNDVLVSVGGGLYDNNYGQDGVDDIWADSESSEYTDANSFEIASGHEHLVGSFMTLRRPVFWTYEEQPVSRELNGQNFIDPIPIEPGYSKANFSNKPLFANAGPSVNDIFQGSVGDCYFMAFLGATAKMRPDRIRQLVVDLGDGTYGVHFSRKNGSGFDSTFVRVDGDLYTDSNGKLVYADAGQSDSIWAPIVEKAWAFFRYNQGTYASIAGGDGFVQEALAMELTNRAVGIHPEVDTAAELASYLKTQLTAGKPTVMGGPPGLNANTTLTGGRSSAHIYVVDAVYTTTAGTFVRLRNPWDGATAVDISIELAFARCKGIESYS